MKRRKVERRTARYDLPLLGSMSRVALGIIKGRSCWRHAHVPLQVDQVDSSVTSG